MGTSRLLSLTTAIGTVTVLGAAPAAAHSQTVTPPGREPVREDVSVSRLWAQAHCNATSPEILADRGAATFDPAGALACFSDFENPAGRSHPHAEPRP